MPATESFQRNIHQYQQAGPTNEVNMQLDPIRSEYPRNPASGYYSWGATSNAKTSVLLVPSTKVFVLKKLIITQRDGPTAQVHLYDGLGVSVTVLDVLVGPSQTTVIDAQGLLGVHFNSAVHATAGANSNMGIRVGGFLRDDDNLNL